jgi:hypothetical protein
MTCRCGSGNGDWRGAGPCATVSKPDDRLPISTPNSAAAIPRASFAQQRLRPHDRDFEAARGIDAATRDAFSEIGLAALEWPETLGGAGLGAFARALVLEELGAADAGAALALDPLGPAFYALAECGEEAALQEIAQPLLERPCARAVLAWNGAARVAPRDGRASGVLPWVPADRVDLLVLLDGDTVTVIDEGIAPRAALPGHAAGVGRPTGLRARMVGEPARRRPPSPGRGSTRGAGSA